MPDIPENTDDIMRQYQGLIHFAFATGSPERLHALTGKSRADGYQITGELRWTGDGYCESAIPDPDGNRVEIAA